MRISKRCEPQDSHLFFLKKGRCFSDPFHHRSLTQFDWTLHCFLYCFDGVFGKIGEGGVAVDTVEDMERLFDGFDLSDSQLKWKGKSINIKGKPFSLESGTSIPYSPLPYIPASKGNVYRWASECFAMSSSRFQIAPLP